MFDLCVTDQIATVTMNRPPVNAMSSDWVGEFHAMLDRLDERDDWVVLHVRSGVKVFSAGADLKEMRARFARPDGIDAMVQAIRDYQRLFARIEALPRVTPRMMRASACRKWPSACCRAPAARSA